MSGAVHSATLSTIYQVHRAFLLADEDRYILGVSRGAEPDTIQANIRLLHWKHHVNFFALSMPLNIRD